MAHIHHYGVPLWSIDTPKNLPLTLEDITVANVIFGPELGSIKGKLVRTTPSPVVQYYATIPALNRQLCRNTSIAVGVMYVNSLIFMVTASKSLKYKTSMYIKSWKKPQLVSGLT